MIPSIKSLNIFNDLFYKSKKKPIIEILGEYLRLSYFEKIKRNIKIKSNRGTRVIIASSGFDGIPKLSMKYFLVNMIELLLSHKIKVVFRPHPSDILDDEAIKIKHKLFIFDNSENYFLNNIFHPLY